jgi:hypothetical protein
MEGTLTTVEVTLRRGVGEEVKNAGGEPNWG